jgi:hypothetical protein
MRAITARVEYLINRFPIAKAVPDKPGKRWQRQPKTKKMPPTMKMMRMMVFTFEPLPSLAETIGIHPALRRCK